MDRPEPSYNDLLRENQDLSEKVKNHVYELQCARNRHVLDLQSLDREAETMQVKIKELEQRNQGLISALTKLEEVIRSKQVEFTIACFIGQGRTGLWYDDLVKRVDELEAENQELRKYRRI